MTRRLEEIRANLARELDEANQTGPPYVSAMDVKWLIEQVESQRDSGYGYELLQSVGGILRTPYGGSIVDQAERVMALLDELSEAIEEEENGDSPPWVNPACRYDRAVVALRELVTPKGSGTP